MASAKEIALLERKLKSAKTNREKIVLAKELKELKSKLTTTQKQESLPTQRRKIRMLSSAEFNELIARLKQKPEYSFLKSMGKKKIEDDYRVVGKPVGWRIKGKDNYKVPSKRFRQENPDLVYFENRINRSDVRKPNRLEHGGNLYKVKDGQDVWYLTYIDSTHFFLSNSEDFKGNAYHIGQFRGRPFYDEVNEWLKSETRKRHSYETGGSISKDGMMHFVLNEMSSGFIANHSNADNYAETSKIRNKMIQILKKDGDSKYSLSKAVALVKKAETSSKYETGGSLKKKIVKHPKAFKIDLDVESRMGNNEHFEVGKIKGYGDALVSRSALQHNAPDNYKYSVKPTNKYAKGGGVKKRDLVEYVVPNWSVPCLINGDFSGLSDEDEQSLDDFIQRVQNDCGNALFMLGEKSDDYGFSYRNDVNRYAGDVTTLYIMPDNSYARGGGVEKGVEWDRDEDGYRTELGNFKINISPSTQKGYWDVSVNENKKSIGKAYDVYGINKAKDKAYNIIENSYKMAKGGGLKKKDDEQPPVPKAVKNPMEEYDVQLLESKSDKKEEKGKYFMFPKPANDNSRGVLFEKGGEIKVGDWVSQKKGTARGKVYQDTGKFIKLEDKYGNKSTTLHSKSDFKRSVKPRY